MKIEGVALLMKELLSNTTESTEVKKITSSESSTKHEVQLQKHRGSIPGPVATDVY